MSLSYPHLDAGYAPQIQDRIILNAFITPGHHRQINCNVTSHPNIGPMKTQLYTTLYLKLGKQTVKFETIFCI